MTIDVRNLRLTRIGAVAGLWLALCPLAWAQEPAGAPPAEEELQDPSAPVDPRPPAGSSAGGLVEHLGPEAYPAPRTRGIRGGSLELTFHGLQWPYVPRSTVGVSGYAWVDTGYEQITTNSETHPDQVYWLQQARALLRVTPTYANGTFFVQAQAELVGNKDQSVSQSSNAGVVDTDDLWLRIGNWRRWDLQVGRYEAWEIYHLGMGLDLNTLERRGPTDRIFGDPVDFYGVTYGYYRSSGVGNVGLHLYPGQTLRLELLGQVGFENNYDTLGGRPAAVLDFGFLKIKGAAEYRKSRGQFTTTNSEGRKVSSPEELIQRGAGGSVQLVLNPGAELGVNGAVGLVDHTTATGSDDFSGSFTVRSVGGFANFAPGRWVGSALLDDVVIGGGINYTDKKDLQEPNAGHFTHLQSFGAVQVLVARQLYIKAVVAIGQGTWEHVQNSTEPRLINTMVSGRLRFLYLF